MSADDHLLPLRDDRPAWHQHAACRGMTALFFPPRGENAHHAKNVCAECPVREQCLNDALTNGDKHGVWGGASEAERRRMRSVRKCRQCGTVMPNRLQQLCSDACRAAARAASVAAYNARNKSPDGGTHECPECGFLAANAGGLNLHRARAAGHKATA